MTQHNYDHYFFYVAKDEQGIKDFYYGELYKEHLLQIPIKYQDIINCRSLISNLNKKLSLLISIDEDEWITVEMLPSALKVAEEFYEKEADPEKKKSISTFVSVIKKAIELNSPILINW